MRMFPNVSYSRHDDSIIVDPNTHYQDDVPNGLEWFKLLPSNAEGDDPDDDATKGVKNHSGGGIHSLSDSESSKVEEGNAEHQTKRCDKYLWRDSTG